MYTVGTAGLADKENRILYIGIALVLAVVVMAVSYTHLNQDEIGENELLVVSFGTSFNDSRTKDIGGIEKALQAANPDWSVRRAFTAQIIINHVQARDDEKIDNMEQALERAVDNGVKNLVVQPTHLMHGAEYDELSDVSAEQQGF